MEYKDFTFEMSDYNRANEVYDSNAVLNAIKIIILSKPGNFPLTPKCGVDISKYQFDLLDDTTIEEIKRDITNQVSEYIPSIDNFTLSISKVNSDENPNITALGISLSATSNGETTDGGFLLVKDKEVLTVHDITNN